MPPMSPGGPPGGGEDPGSKQGLSYKGAGVDIDAMDTAIRGIKERVRGTYSDAVLSDTGSFGGMFRLPAGTRFSSAAWTASGRSCESPS